MKKYNRPPGLSFIQSFLRSFRLVNSPIEAIEENMVRFKETYSVSTGINQTTILTQDPEFIDYILKRNHRNYHKSAIVSETLGRFIGNGLLTSNGDYWLRQRRLIQPGFHLQKIQALYGIMKKTIDGFLREFPTGDAIDVYPLMNKLAFEIVINTLFNVDLPREKVNELSVTITELQAFVIKEIRQPFNSWWLKLSGQVKKNLKKSARLRNIMREIIQQRKSSGRAADDLLDMLLKARYEDTQQPMTEEQLIDEILILIIAGHETTANALSWTLYLLATHPQEQDRLAQSEEEGPIESIIDNPVLAAAVKESMRLYPPAWISDRVALTDDSFKGYSFPKGTIIIAFYYGLHRDERFWSAAQEFRPARFLVDGAEKEMQKVYFPFGGGPRLCIGNHFAMAEMVLFLDAFVRQFEIHATGVPNLLPLVTLRPDRVVLSVKRRTP